MKSNYYKIRSALKATEALSYLHSITSMVLTNDDLIELAHEGAIDCFVEAEGEHLCWLAPDFERQDLVIPKGLQKICNLGRGDLDTSFRTNEIFLRIYNPFDIALKDYPVNKSSIVLYGELDRSENKTGWSTTNKGFQQEREYVIFFSREELDVLAARLIHMQEGGDQAQELERLKAEVERLKAENAELISMGANTGVANDLLFTHVTENLRLAARVQQEFYDPARFDIEDPDSYPLKGKILDKLKEWGIDSDTTAKAIERVATPFSRDKAKK